MPLPPEQIARRDIDLALQKSGWVVQNYKAIDFTLGKGIAICEYPTDSGPADYILFVDKIPIGIIETNGGIGKIYQLFGKEIELTIEELNKELVA
ncbi:MAG: hypothetical protein ED557_11730 [Balneola sp.]|nr:MAG: hypothetical protein ED557_11730 [Balneola sp.]